MVTKRRRRQFSPDFKFKVALAASGSEFSPLTFGRGVFSVNVSFGRMKIPVSEADSGVVVSGNLRY
ncbi:MAG: hypothetical protein OXC80_10715 [Gammaproteobacteria bacterium]|nr:hypothetical protein [Gammaproteobacteria bacterium]